MAVLLRPGTTPSGAEIRNHLCRLVRRIRQHWPHTRLTIRDGDSAEWPYDTLYCACDQVENLIKLHKSKLASDRTNCRSALANQVRLALHTGAFWLMLGLRAAIPAAQPLARAEFITLWIRLIKIGARFIETVSPVWIAFGRRPSRDGAVAHLVRCLQPTGP